MQKKKNIKKEKTTPHPLPFTKNCLSLEKKERKAGEGQELEESLIFAGKEDVERKHQRRPYTLARTGLGSRLSP